MSNWKKSKGYADGGEIQDDTEEMPGIRLGQNANISDDTRSRAMAMVERLNKGKDPDSKPARKAAPKAAPRVTDTGDETSRLAARKTAPKGLTNDDDPSIPRAEYDATEKPRSRTSRFMDDLGDNASKAFQATVAGGVAAKGVKAGVGALRRSYQGAKQADDIMAAGARRAQAARDKVNDIRYFEGGMKDGGMVGGCSPRDYGKK